MHDSALVCFRNDFRLLDNPALFEAVRLKKKVIPVFIYDPSAFGDWDLGVRQSGGCTSPLRIYRSKSLRSVDV